MNLSLTHRFREQARSHRSCILGLKIIWLFIIGI